MNKVIGICDLHNDPHLGELTKNRPLGAVTFLGRYGLIDFTLSNFSNSHIDKVYVLVRKGIVALRKHIGSGSIWTNNTKLGYVELLINEKGLTNKAFNTDINNIKSGLDIDELDFDQAVIAPGYMLSSMDFRPLVSKHITSGAAITCIYKHVDNADKDYFQCDKYKLDSDNHIVKSSKNHGRTDEADISLDTFIISKKALLKLIKDSSKVSELYSIKDMVNHYIEDGSYDVRGIEFNGYVVPILTLEGYVSHSLNLLNYHIRNQLFFEDWPIYTTTHNTPPALYGKDADVQNSFIANGAIVKGKVYNSIISRDVVIEKGSDVRNSIIFTKTLIGKDTKLDHVLIDKNVKVLNVKKMVGSEEDIIVISQGATI